MPGKTRKQLVFSKTGGHAIGRRRALREPLVLRRPEPDIEPEREVTVTGQRRWPRLGDPTQASDRRVVAGSACPRPQPSDSSLVQPENELVSGRGRRGADVGGVHGL